MALLAGCNGAGSQTVFLSAASDAGCDSLRIEVDLEEARGNGHGGEPKCALAESAEADGCEATIETSEERVVAVIRNCGSRDGTALLECSFPHAAPSSEELVDATDTVCACDCGDDCEGDARICAFDDESELCPAANSAQARSAERASRATGAQRAVGDNTACRVTFSMTSPDLAGAVQLRIQSSDSAVHFVNRQANVRCESLVPSALSSFNSKTETSLDVGFISPGGMQGPLPLFVCKVTASGQREPSSFDVFDIEVVDATDPVLGTITPTFAQTDIDCSRVMQETTTCRTSFEMTSSETAGSLQLEIESGDETVSFVGAGSTVQCSSLAPSALSAFFAPDRLSLNAGFVAPGGIQGPAPLLACDVRGIGHLESSAFEVFDVDIVDATDVSGEPIRPTVSQTTTEDCVFATQSTTSTASPGSTNTIPPTTTLGQLTTTTHGPQSTTTSVTVDTTQTTQTTGTTYVTSTTRNDSGTVRVRFSLRASRVVVAANFQAFLEDQVASFSGCSAVQGVEGVSVSIMDSTLAVCLYEQTGLAAGTHALVECDIETRDGFDPEIESMLGRALDSDLAAVEDAAIQVEILSY